MREAGINLPGGSSWHPAPVRCLHPDHPLDCRVCIEAPGISEWSEFELSGDKGAKIAQPRFTSQPARFSDSDRPVSSPRCQERPQNPPTVLETQPAVAVRGEQTAGCAGCCSCRL